MWSRFSDFYRVNNFIALDECKNYSEIQRKSAQGRNTGKTLSLITDWNRVTLDSVFMIFLNILSVPCILTSHRIQDWRFGLFILIGVFELLSMYRYVYLRRGIIISRLNHSAGVTLKVFFLSRCTDCIYTHSINKLFCGTLNSRKAIELWTVKVFLRTLSKFYWFLSYHTCVIFARIDYIKN